MFSATVVIPVYNGAKYISGQLESLRLQEFHEDFEIIISNNGSTDNIYEVVEEYKKINNLNNIRIIDSSQKKGVSHARNEGVKNSSSEIILFCDADDFVEKNWIESHLHAHSLVPNAVVVGKLEPVEDNGNLQYDSCAVQSAFGSVESGFEVPELMDDLKNLFDMTCAGGNISFKKSEYLKIGGMDSSYTGGSEDIDFLYRCIIENKSQPVYLNGGVIAYRQRSTPRNKFRQVRIWAKNDQLLYSRFSGFSRKHTSMKYSFVNFLKELIKYPFVSFEEKIYSSKMMGIALGTIEGTLKYKYFQRIPDRDLIDGSL